jgi:uncharacterized damage-inducible protein DinB
MTLDALFTYSERCRPRLYETLAEIEEVRPGLLEREFPTTSAFNTIAKLIAHCHGAEERWVVARLLNQPVATPYEDRAPTDLAGLIADGDQLRAQTHAFLASQTPETLSQQREMVLRDRTALMTAEEVLFHVLNHESWHRAQISLLLQHWGFDPPNFDYAAFV